MLSCDVWGEHLVWRKKCTGSNEMVFPLNEWTGASWGNVLLNRNSRTACNYKVFLLNEWGRASWDNLPLCRKSHTVFNYKSFLLNEWTRMWIFNFEGLLHEKPHWLQLCLFFASVWTLLIFSSLAILKLTCSLACVVGTNVLGWLNREVIYSFFSKKWKWQYHSCFWKVAWFNDISCSSLDIPKKLQITASPT